ncbi:MAG: hypothetical protein ABI691_20445 [Ginsengibacter sp.]
MPSQKFRKLDIDLPRQTLFNQRPWLVAGLILAFTVLLMIAFAYFERNKKMPSPRQQQENGLIVLRNNSGEYS